MATEEGRIAPRDDPRHQARIREQMNLVMQPEREKATPVDPNFEPTDRGTLIVKNQSPTFADRHGMGGFELDRPKTFDTRFLKGPFSVGDGIHAIFLVTRFVERFSGANPAEVSLESATAYLKEHPKTAIEIKPDGTGNFIGRLIKEQQSSPQTITKASLIHNELDGYTLVNGGERYKTVEVLNKYGETMNIAEIKPLLAKGIEITAKLWEEQPESGKYVAKIVEAQQAPEPTIEEQLAELV
jgi:hypothetical protein